MIPPENATLIDFPTSISWFDEQGILCSIPKKGAPQMTKADAEEYVIKFRNLIGNKKVCLVVKTSGADALPEKEAREWISKELEEFTAAMAVIYSSPMGRMVANLFFSMRPAGYPVKFFSNEKEAKDWIVQFIPT